MAQTLSEKILSQAAGKPVSPGELVVIEPDVVMSHDSLTPGIIKIMEEELGVSHVHTPEQIVMVMDHVAPASTVATANFQNQKRRFASSERIRLYEAGRGIRHKVLVDEKIADPGNIVIGYD